jgi:hypothetical protein
MGLSATDRWLHAIPTARYADARNLTVSTSSNDPLARLASYGYYLHDTAAIWVRGHPEGHRARADMAATFAHELAHAVTHDACAAVPGEQRRTPTEPRVPRPGRGER